jgi:excisionase family DNA binding protein
MATRPPPRNSTIPDRLLTISEAAAMLGLTEVALRKCVQRGTVPYVKLNKRLRFRLSSLERLIAKNERRAVRPLQEFATVPRR